MIAGLEFGTASLGNLYRAVSDEAAHDALAAAWDGGIRTFDTAPHYGLGLAERRLGDFLRTRPRDEYVLTTKVGRLLLPQEVTGSDLENGFAVPNAFRRVWQADLDAVRRSIDASLDRLGLDRIDVAYLHDPDESGTALERAVDTGLASLLQVREQGLVAAVGIGSKSEPALLRATDFDIDRIMCSNRWNLIDRSAAERVLPAAERHSIEVVAVSVYASGLLSRPRPTAALHDEYGPVRPERLALAHAFADVAEAHGVDLPTLALQFPTRAAPVAAVAFGAGSPAHVTDGIIRAERHVPEEAWAAVDAIAVSA